eukprot:786692-Rhodomonas_salina.1
MDHRKSAPTSSGPLLLRLLLPRPLHLSPRFCLSRAPESAWSSRHTTTTTTTTTTRNSFR